MNKYRFTVMLFQLYVILKLYDLWYFITGLSWKVYIMIVITVILIIIDFIGKNHLGRNIPSLLPFKGVKYTKTGLTADLLFIATTSVILGFIYGHLLTIASLYIAITTVILVYFALKHLKKVEKHFKIISLSFFWGLVFTTPLSNNFYVFIISIIGNFIIYFMSDPGQF